MSNSLLRTISKQTGRSLEEVQSGIKKASKVGLSQNSTEFMKYLMAYLKKLPKKESLLRSDPETLLELYTDGTPHRIRSEPMNSASTIFKRDKYLKRRNEKDKNKVVSGKKRRKKKDLEDD